MDVFFTNGGLSDAEIGKKTLPTDVTIRGSFFLMGTLERVSVKVLKKSYDMSMMRHRNPRDREVVFFWGFGGEQDTYFCEPQRVFKDLKPIADS